MEYATRRAFNVSERLKQPNASNNLMRYVRHERWISYHVVLSRMVIVGQVGVSGFRKMHAGLDNQ